MINSKPRLPIKGMTREQHTMAVYTLWHVQLWEDLLPSQREAVVGDLCEVVEFLPCTVQSVKAIRVALEATEGAILNSHAMSRWVHLNRNEIIRIMTLGE